MDVFPLDVCCLILKKLNPIARSRLGSVSRLWRQITKLFEDEAKPPMFPWLMQHPLDSHTLEFLSIEDGYATLKQNVPASITPQRNQQYYHCIGSSNKKGWMVMSTVCEQDSYDPPTIHSWLINPLSCVAVRLPSHKKKHFSIIKAVLSSNHCDSNCVVGAIDHFGKAYFCRVGEPTWAFSGELFLDMVFYKGQFLGYNLVRESLLVFEYDHLGGRVNSKVYHAPLPLEYAKDYEFVYMLESRGEVLLVLRMCPQHALSGRYDHESFKVFKLDSLKYEWMRVDSLEDTILFVGFNNTSTSVSAKDFPAMNLKGNCIYFTSHLEGSWCQGCIDFGVYYLEDGRIEPLFPSHETYPPNAKSPLLWFIPK